MTGQRAKYDAAFKLEIAKMVIDQGLTVSQVVKDTSHHRLGHGTNHACRIGVSCITL